MRKSKLMLIVVLGLVLAACGSSDTQAGSGSTGATTDDEHAEDGGEFWFGAPAEAAESDRVIEVEAKDDFTFSPAEISVAVGETVTFRVTNTGNLPHDFTLGDEAMQDEHEEEMSSGDMHGGDDPNAIGLEPGETKDLTFAFSEAGSIIFGCHVPGHYAAGMRGPLSIGA